MLEGFCLNCQKKSYFTHIKNNTYKCSFCGIEFKKCKNKKHNCLNMINIKILQDIVMTVLIMG